MAGTPRIVRGSLALTVTAACGASDYIGDPGYTPPPLAAYVPLTDLGPGSYLGFRGGGYPGGTSS